MKAIATLTALLFSVAFTFAQEGASKPAKPVRLAQASSQVEASQKEGPQKEVLQKGEGSQKEESINLWEMLQKGGWAMIPLGGAFSADGNAGRGLCPHHQTRNGRLQTVPCHRRGAHSQKGLPWCPRSL